MKQYRWSEILETIGIPVEFHEEFSNYSDRLHSYVSVTPGLTEFGDGECYSIIAFNLRILSKLVINGIDIKFTNDPTDVTNIDLRLDFKWYDVNDPTGEGFESREMLEKFILDYVIEYMTSCKSITIYRLLENIYTINDNCVVARCRISVTK